MPKKKRSASENGTVRVHWTQLTPAQKHGLHQLAKILAQYRSPHRHIQDQAIKHAYRILRDVNLSWEQLPEYTMSALRGHGLSPDDIQLVAIHLVVYEVCYKPEDMCVGMKP